MEQIFQKRIGPNGYPRSDLMCELVLFSNPKCYLPYFNVRSPPYLHHAARGDHPEHSVEVRVGLVHRRVQGVRQVLARVHSDLESLLFSRFHKRVEIGRRRGGVPPQHGAVREVLEDLGYHSLMTSSAEKESTLGLNSIHFRNLTKIFPEKFIKIFRKKLSKFI